MGGEVRGLTHSVFPIVGISAAVCHREHLCSCLRLRRKFQRKAHGPGAMLRRRAKISAAGTDGEAPALYLSKRRAISISHAAAAAGSGAGSTLSRSCRARDTRWSGGRLRPSLKIESSVAVIVRASSHKAARTVKVQVRRRALVCSLSRRASPKPWTGHEPDTLQRVGGISCQSSGSGLIGETRRECGIDG